MKILSIDTSSNICTVAVLEDTTLLKEISQNSGLTHSENLLPMIQNLLTSSNLSIKDIDLFVCDKGPGSFTGIRIGVATAKGFSDSLEKPAVGISSLETLAYNIKNEGIICSLIDAKNENVYVGIFENSGGKYILRRNFSTENIFNLLDEIKTMVYPITFVGDGAIKYKEDIVKKIPNSKFSINNDLSSHNLGLAGLAHYSAGQNDNLLPLYLRKPQAEIVLEQQKRT